MFKWLRIRSEKLDDWLRFRDLRAHRTVGGRLDRWFQIDRHTLPALVLPCLICGLILLASPSWSRSLMAVGCMLIVGRVLVLIMRRSAKTRSVQFDLVVQCLIVLAVAGIVWVVGPDEYQERGVYRHIFIVAAGLLAISLIVAALLVNFMFRRMHAQSCYGDGLQSRYRDYLKATELFASRGPAPFVTFGTILTSLVMVAFRAPLALLTLPAIVALVSPTAFVWYFTIPTLAICFLGLFFAGLNERFGAMWTLIQAAFFKGGALLVSVIVIVLGIARLAGNTYVTPIFDTAAWWSLGITLASVYILSWWYDYWLNRLLTDQIITLLNPDVRGRAQIPYNILPDHAATSVPADSRVLQIHGAARFLAYREGPPYFQAWTMSDLIELVTESGAPGGKAVPSAAQVRSRILNFHSVVVALFALLLGMVAYQLHQGKQNPEVCVKQGDNGKDLTTLLFDSDGNPPDRTLVVIAGSGGGTRAALYTASILEGITNMGKGKDIILGSGVSGGGAALAYFAGNRDSLTSTDDRVRQDAWQRYFEIMAKPYIQEVLNRATEWRMAGPGRLGQLLDASFRRNWGLKNPRLSDVKDMGLIFNTSLAGHVQRPACAPPGKLSDVEPCFRDKTKSTLAGGRLLLTNLALSGLVATPLEPPDPQNPLPRLPVIIQDPDLRLEDAAALNANFPPVFSNAAIDVDDKTRYWVTDGGAVDNRGMEMMLFALRQVLKGRPPDKLPRLLIVVADASALSDKYTQNRGVSSLAGAGTHFASHLNAELFDEIQQMYEDKKDRLQFAYVMMPDHLRESGSFGTNWMLQSWIRVRNGSDLCPREVKIKGKEMIQVLRALHTPGADKDLHPKPCQVLNWSRNDFGHKDGWATVVKVLGGTNISPTCSTQ